LGSPRPNEKGQELMDMLAEELGKLPNKISIEGHTDSKAYTKAGITEIGSFPVTGQMPRVV